MCSYPFSIRPVLRDGSEAQPGELVPQWHQLLVSLCYLKLVIFIYLYICIQPFGHKNYNHFNTFQHRVCAPTNVWTKLSPAARSSIKCG